MITYHMYDEHHRKSEINENIKQYPIIKIIEEFSNNNNIHYNIEINYNYSSDNLRNIRIYPHSKMFIYEADKLYITPQSEIKFNVSYIINHNPIDIIVEYNDPKFVELIFNALKEYHLYIDCLISSISNIQENYNSPF